MSGTLEKAGGFHAPLSSESMNKIAEVTVAFWIMKIIATTLGETTGDFIAQTLNLGYVAGLGITGAMLAAILFFQVRVNAFHPALRRHLWRLPHQARFAWRPRPWHLQCVARLPCADGRHRRRIDAPGTSRQGDCRRSAQ